MVEFTRRCARVLTVSVLLAALAAGIGAPRPLRATRTAASTTFPAYWLGARDGGVFSLGLARYFGSLGGRRLNAPIVTLSATPSGNGYWLAGADGGIFAFGDAPFAGSTGGLRLNAPVVGMAPTPSGNGYWLVASDGGIFAFGDAPFAGSTGGLRLNAPVVGMAPTPSGRGYWLVARDGGVFAFGDAVFAGSTGGMHLNQPVVAMSAAGARGYWLVASDGGIFAFGDAPFLGSTAGTRLDAPIVGMAPTVDSDGYWLVGADGGVFTFGNAPYRGSMGGRHLNAPVVAVARTVSADPYPPGGTGFDISWPQCGGAFPPPAAITVVGVNDGRPFTHNPCFASELAWAGSATSVYLNTGFPPAGAPQAMSGPAGPCDPADTACQAYNYGFSAAHDAYDFAVGAGARGQLWWLDVETKNGWPTDTSANARVVTGMIDALQAVGVTVGVYSTGFQWGKIAGGYAPGLPIWVAGASSGSDAPSFCGSAKAFAGGDAWLAQYPNPPYDGDYGC